MNRTIAVANVIPGDEPADLAAELDRQTAELVRLRRLAIETLLAGQVGAFDDAGVLYDRRMRWAIETLKVTGGVACGADSGASPRPQETTR